MRIAFFLSCLFASAVALAAERTIDGSSDATFKRSLSRMQRSLDQDEQRELVIALLQITLSGARSARDAMALQDSKGNIDFALARNEIDGMTADEIVAYSKKVATTKVESVTESPR